MEICPPVRSHSSPMASWSTRPVASGANAEGVGARRGQGGGLDLVAVGRERLEAVPQLVGRRRRRPSGLQRERHRREQLVHADAGRTGEAGHRMEPPFERGAAGPVVAQPGLRPVDVGVDRLAEALVERHDELGADPPDAGRGAAGHRPHASQAGSSVPPVGFERLSARMPSSFTSSPRRCPSTWAGSCCSKEVRSSTSRAGSGSTRPARPSPTASTSSPVIARSSCSCRSSRAVRCGSTTRTSTSATTSVSPPCPHRATRSSSRR